LEEDLASNIPTWISSGVKVVNVNKSRRSKHDCLEEQKTYAMDPIIFNGSLQELFQV
jgi:hypothetical protein